MSNEKPKNSNVMEEFWHQKMHRLHKFKLNNIKGHCDTSAPKSFKAKPKDLK